MSQDERAETRATTDFERRRRHLPHWEQPGAVYYITFALREGVRAQLSEAQLARLVVDALHHDHGTRYELHTYVIMPDHVHVILRPVRRGKGTVPLSEIMKTLKGVTAHRINAALGRRGPLWRDESHDRIIRNPTEYAQKVRYIETNPVVAGLVERADDWPWTWPQLRPGQDDPGTGTRANQDR